MVDTVSRDPSVQPLVLTVSELNRLVRESLESLLPAVWVRGEISNFSRAASGHMYFSLKDANAVVRCVMFKQYGRYLPKEPTDGEHVSVQGRVTVYERSGQYQVVVVALEPLGRGALAAQFEELKQKLKREGLFDESAKKPLPTFVRVLGVATSPDGAAIRDILEVATKRFPGIQVIISPTQVQGDAAAVQIVQALESLVRDGRADAIIVGRGGGSLEDLWPFNEEIVARAIYGCPIPVVSAVGHETDFTIADFVADFRAPTPSAAAEIVVPDGAALEDEVGRMEARMERAMGVFLRVVTERLRRLAEAHGLRRAEDVLMVRQQRLDEMTVHLGRSLPLLLGRTRDRLSGLEHRLQALSPRGVLERGYSITRLLPDLRVVSDALLLDRGDLVDITFARGAAVCSVTDSRAREE